MKYLRLINDKSKRLFFKKGELKKNVTFLLSKKNECNLLLGSYSILPNFVSCVEIKNYCILSGRSRGVLKDFKLSRILLRKMGAKGFLSGIRKNSW
jgi:small subunit ribosomal protein S14